MTKKWNEHKAVIIGLYREKNKPLHEVQRIMDQEYRFKASIRAYRSRFDKWGVHKYNCRKRNDLRCSASASASPPPASPPVATAQQDPVSAPSHDDFGRQDWAEDYCYYYGGDGAATTAAMEQQQPVKPHPAGTRQQAAYRLQNAMHCPDPVASMALVPFNVDSDCGAWMDAPLPLPPAAPGMVKFSRVSSYGGLG